ncbi:hypothetical protein Tco_0484260 [Tanacetum coccineum]
MGYFISMQPRSNVRFSALVLDPEEKSSFYPNNFPSMILQKIVCVSLGGKRFSCLNHHQNLDTMIDVNGNAPAEQAPAMAPPTRTDDQILPRIRCLPIGKRNCYLDVESCQLDEQWFDLTKYALRNALQITPVDTNNAFSSPPTPDALIKFVSDLGYPRVVRTLSDVVTNDMFQPWRALTTEVFGIPIPNDLITDDIRETSEVQSPAKRSKAGKVVKKRTKKSSFQLVDEFADEGVPGNEPRIGNEEADLEPESGKFQPILEVQGKVKEKVSDEQVALDLLTLQTPKKKSPADQYIFQRRTSIQTEPSGHDESSSLYAELGLTDSETDSDEEVSGIVARVQDEGQAGPNPGEHDEDHARPNPGDAAASQPPSSHVVHAGPNLEHMDLEASDTSIQPNPKLEEPASSAGTLSSLQHLDKELSFTDQFLVVKSQEEEPEKTNTESKESNSYQAHEDHKQLYEALEKSMARDHTNQLLTDLVEAQRKKKKRHASPKTQPGSPPHQPPPLPSPASSSGTLGASGASGSSQLPYPPPPSSTNQSDQSTSTAAPSSSKTAASAEYTTWTTTDTRLKSCVLSIPEELHIDDDTTHED